MGSSKIKNNFIYQIVYQIFVLAIPFVMSPYVSRILGAEGLGIYSYTYSIAYYYVLIMMLGVLNYGNRTIAKCRDNQDELNREFSGLLILHLLLGIICTILYLGYIVCMAQEKTYALIQGIYVISGVFDITWFYYGIEKFKLIVERNIIIKIITVILVFLLVEQKSDLWIYCLIMACSIFLSQIMLWFPLSKYVKFIIPTRYMIFKHLKPMFVLFIPTIAISIYKYMDRIMIGMLSTKIELGYYENAENAIRILTSILSSLGTVMLPRMSNMVIKKEINEVQKYIKKSMYYLMIATFAMTFGMMGIADIFAPIFWGNEFIMSSRVIKILVFSVPFVSFANVIRTQFLLPNERDKEYTRSVVIGAIVNLGLNIILIPRYGASGAAIATVCAEMLVCVVQGIEVRKELPIKKYVIDIVPFIVIGLVEFVIVFFIKQIDIISSRIICLVVQVVSGIIVYCVPTFIMLYLRKDEYIVKFLKK